MVKIKSTKTFEFKSNIKNYVRVIIEYEDGTKVMDYGYCIEAFYPDGTWEAMAPHLFNTEGKYEKTSHVHPGRD